MAEYTPIFPQHPMLSEVMLTGIKTVIRERYEHLATTAIADLKKQTEKAIKDLNVEMERTLANLVQEAAERVALDVRTRIHDDRLKETTEILVSILDSKEKKR